MRAPNPELKLTGVPRGTQIGSEICAGGDGHGIGQDLEPADLLTRIGVDGPVVNKLAAVCTRSEVEHAVRDAKADPNVRNVPGFVVARLAKAHGVRLGRWSEANPADVTDLQRIAGLRTSRAGVRS